MKRLFFLVLLLLVVFAQAQIPKGYYKNANGKTGYSLKTALNKIITSGHNNKGYDALYTAYKTTDTDEFYEKDNSVLDMYSENPVGKDPYNYQHKQKNCGNYKKEFDCYNREHLFPQGFFNKRSPMKNDVHFVVPSDGYVNGRRSNYPFGEVSSYTWKSKNGCKVGKNTTMGYSGTVFEPINEFKGDIARCLFYFATRYENSVTSGSWKPHNSTNNPLNGTNGQVYETWYLQLLMKWHKQDPVSKREISRNNACYAFQGNRNPFIDHPEYASIIWDPNAKNPIAPTNLTVGKIANTALTLSWTASVSTDISNYLIYKDGVLYNTVGNVTSINIVGLSENTEYEFFIKAKNTQNEYSLPSSSIKVKTKKSVGFKSLLTHGINIYPSPANNFVTIESSGIIRIKDIQIYNLSGKLLYIELGSSKLGKPIDVSVLNSGLYYLQLKGDKEVLVTKLWIVR